MTIILLTIRSSGDTDGDTDGRGGLGAAGMDRYGDGILRIIGIIGAVDRCGEAVSIMERLPDSPATTGAHSLTAMAAVTAYGQVRWQTMEAGLSLWETLPESGLLPPDAALSLLETGTDRRERLLYVEMPDRTGLEDRCGELARVGRRLPTAVRVPTSRQTIIV